MNTHLSRRAFLSSVSAATAFSIVPRHVLGGPKFVPPSEKVNIALIGCGGQGRTNVRALFNQDDAQVIAVCDPMDHLDLSPYYYKGLAGRKPVKAEIEKHYREKTPNHSVSEYEDFRKLLDSEKSLDAVLIATPDHLHANISITAMKLGKHVYCEKPLTHNIWEARLVAKVARETGVATQMGNHGHSGEGIRQTVEWIRDGAIGPVREVHAWSSAGRFVTERPKDTPPVPKGLNWDLWLGPRENRPYHPTYVPFKWRGYWDFGTAALGDMSPHHIDSAVWALKLDHPVSVEATGAVLDDVINPLACTACWSFGPRDNMPAVKMFWYDGGLRPATPDIVDILNAKQRLGEGDNGTFFVGEKGIITAAGWGGMPRLIPMDLHRDYKRPEKTLKRVKGHHADWLSACKGGEPASSNFEVGAKLTEIVLLGNVALRCKKKILWDGPAMKATNAPEADKFLKETYRKGWELPA